VGIAHPTCLHADDKRKSQKIIRQLFGNCSVMVMLGNVILRRSIWLIHTPMLILGMSILAMSILAMSILAMSILAMSIIARKCSNADFLSV
jgi:hypothetical protein